MNATPVLDGEQPAHPDDSATETTIDKRALRLVFAGLVVAMLLSSLDQTVFSTALPTIVGELGGVEHMLWVTTAYLVAATTMMPVYGKLGDLIGRKSLFMAALGLFLIGSVAGGLADSMAALITGRAIQGLGGGGLVILAQAIIADVVPPRQRGRYMGILGAVFGLSAVLGPLLGGWFTDGPGWRWAFWLNIPLSLAAIAAAAVFLREPQRATGSPKLDVAGITTMAVAVTAAVLVTSWAGTEYAWSSPTILILSAVAVVAAVVFVYVESRAVEPVIPLRLFRDRNFNLATLGGLCLAIAMFGAVGYLPTYLQMVTGLSATLSGLLLLPMVGAVMAAATTSGTLASSTGRYKWMPLVGTLLVSAALLLLATVRVDTSLWLVCSYLFLLGAGIGLGLQILVLIVQNSFPVTQVGTATAANNFFREIGASFGSALVGTLFTSRLVHLLHEKTAGLSGASRVDANSLTPSLVNDLPTGLREAVVSAYNDALMPVFLYLVPLMLVGFVALLFVDEKPLATTNDLPSH